MERFPTARELPFLLPPAGHIHSAEPLVIRRHLDVYGPEDRQNCQT